MVGHDGSAVDEDAAEVGKGRVVDVGAAVANADTVVDAIVAVVNEFVFPSPVPNAVGPVDIRLLAGDATEAGGELKEAAVADGVFIVLAIGVARENLPKDAAVAVFSEPAVGEGFKDVFGNLEP